MKLKILIFALILVLLTGCGTPAAPEALYSPGTWEDGRYTSEFLGLTYDLPEGWVYSSPQELNLLAEQNGAPPTEKQLQGDFSEYGTFFDMMASHEGGEGVIIISVRYTEEATETLVEDIFAVSLDNVTQLYGEGGTQVGERFEYEIAGKTFTVQPVSFSGYITQWICLYTNGQYICQLSMVTMTTPPETLLESFAAI